MKKFIAFAAVGLAVAASPPAHAADKMQLGLITQCVDGGYWARFAHPVRQGAMAQVRAFHESAVVATVKINWASTVAPYEAFLTDLNPTRTKGGEVQTEYEKLFHERHIGNYSDRGEPICPGYSIEAAGGAPTKANYLLEANIEMLLARDEFRELLRIRGVVESDRDKVVLAAQAPYRKYQDPVPARLVSRVRDLAAERSMVGGDIFSDWFPLGLSHLKMEEGH